MESSNHTLKELFSQLGLPDGSAAIENFIEAHRPLPRTIKLGEAPFWTKAQRQMLQQAISTDADWAVLVDQLDARLR
ncbi:MAG: DUF2789 domain-containing protein [Pseudomonadota bacterium]